MELTRFTYQSIGTIHSPHENIKGMPIQPASARGISGTVEVDPRFQPGLKDLTGFSHLILMYHFHRVDEVRLHVVPFLDNQKRGVFSTRAPMRPNPIGLSVVRLVRVERNVLHVKDIDVLDGTPLLDIKPYVPEFDGAEEVNIGWIEGAKEEIDKKRSDDRFS